MSQFTPYFTENLLDPTQWHFKQGTKVGVVIDSRGNAPKPPYCMVGSLRMYQSNQYGKPYPLLETMCDFSKSEGWFFKILLDTHNELSGVSDISKVTFTKSDLNVLSKAYTVLHQRDLVKRVRRQVYMINPSALITNNWEAHKPIWDTLP